MLRMGIIVSIAVFAQTAHARWAGLDDAPIAERTILEIEVNKDGTHRSTQDTEYEVLKENGRVLSNFKLTYNSRTTKVKILVAETINKTEAGIQTFKVEPQFIEDKPVADRNQGFDQRNLITIAFPQVSVGSKLHLKYVEEISEIPIKDHYSAKFELGTDYFLKDFQLKLKSEIPLYTDVVDPYKKIVLNEKNKKADKSKNVEVSLKGSIYTSVIDEPWAHLLDKRKTTVFFSSHKDYADIGNSVAEAYEQVLSEKLPPLYEEVLTLASKNKGSEADVINVVTSELAKRIRYLGDWRPIKGGHIPRPLSTIAETRFGDCKDFTASTISILRKLGFDAQPVWVMREQQPDELAKLANPYFNHAIVWARSKDRVFWIDPTNFTSFAQGIYEDILGRQALVIEKGKSRIESIPKTSPLDSQRKFDFSVELSNDGNAKIDAQIAFLGRSAIAFTGDMLKESKEHIDHKMITGLVTENRMLWKKISHYDLTSRIVRDLNFKLSYGEKDFSLRSTLGPAVRLDQTMVDFLINLEAKKRVSDLFLGAPQRMSVIRHFKNIRLKGEAPTNCRVSGPSLMVERKINIQSNSVEVEDVREIIDPFLTIEQIRSQEFARFQQDVQKCFDRLVIVYENI